VTETPNALRFSDEDRARYQRLYAPDHTKDEIDNLFNTAERTQLDPFSRQIYSIKRYNFAQKREVAQVQTSIDGFRLQAERGGSDGQLGPFFCGNDGVWVDVWVKPMSELFAAKVGALKKGAREPFWGVARFNAYAQRLKPQREGAEGALNSIWAKMGDTMIAKCAEALALRKAHPARLSGLYTTEEMMQADPTPAEGEEKAPKAPPKPALAPPAPKAAPVAPAPAPAKPAAEEPDEMPDGEPETVPPVEAAAPKASVDSFDDLRKEISAWKTPAKANAGIPVILALQEPARAAAQKIFKEHRLAMRWERGSTADGAIVVRPMNIDEWTDIARARSGVEIIEAMTGEERATAMQALEVKCHEQGWKLVKAPKIAISEIKK
jgi:phage recombination protein Bet